MADHQKGDVEDPSAALIFVGALVLLIAITLYIEGYINQATPQGTIWIIAETLLLFGLSLIPLGSRRPSGAPSGRTRVRSVGAGRRSVAAWTGARPRAPGRRR